MTMNSLLNHMTSPTNLILRTCVSEFVCLCCLHW